MTTMELQALHWLLRRFLTDHGRSRKLDEAYTTLRRSINTALRHQKRREG
jgi:hypothetical protein